MKYSAQAIANILNASSVIDTLNEPAPEVVYEKTKSVINLLEQILPPSNIECQYKHIHITSKCDLFISLYKTDYENGHKFGFVFDHNNLKWDGTRVGDINEPQDFKYNMYLSNWYAILQNKDSIIEQAIEIRQKINAAKVARINSVQK